ncbi:MAG: hypothetical protein KJN64_08065 [Ignavibacteria bacterium]|nr:hypothetical protein [Ignavibacteria bacterium]MBT8383444.1 hypothetical protein [Ignavibacteria bacterium]NNL22360.1 hypothetical protein [Ignavibacteriaceae bacterium]
MNNIEKLSFDNWFQDKIELSKTDSFQIVRVISVSKNTQWLGRDAQNRQLPGTSVTKTILNTNFYYDLCGCFVS